MATQPRDSIRRKLTKAETEAYIIQQANEAAEKLLQLALRGPDGVVACIDAMATVHATILMRLFNDEDWPGLLKTYHSNVADKIIAVGQAMAKALEESVVSRHHN